MTHLCEYGCGQLAVHFKTPSTKVPNGRWSCATSPNSCPAKRCKTTGDKNPSRRPAVRKIISEINSVLFASGSNLRQQCQATLLRHHGVKNPMHIKEVADKVVATRRANNNYYPFSKEAHSPAANKKRKETRIKRGYDTDPILKEPFDRYEQEVDKITASSYKKYKNLINPADLIRGRVKGTYQLDHIISKVEGFKLNIVPDIIAHPANLRMLTIEDNISKGVQSHYTLEQLLKIIEKFTIYS